ncbi:MAG: moeA [Planctomycetaceae bacterium]|nr:moeA [Planctomycetaceae bacterium]
MLTVSEALAAIRGTVVRGPILSLPLDEALGLILAEVVVSGVDSPPFDKALMDGYAVRFADLTGHRKGTTHEIELTVIEEVTAGRVPGRSVGPGQATRIMTGAPLPAGADVVIPVEDTDFHPFTTSMGDIPSDLGQVRLRDVQQCRPGRFILRQGAAVKQGAEILKPGRMLRAQEIAALAELGFTHVRVTSRPRVGILATGDELVPAGTKPGPGQIQNSNEPMLAAQIQQAGAGPIRLGIARDEREHLRQRILQGLDCDFLLLSGGVSAGKLDLVPSELAAAGVRQVFHKIQMRPGKPLWFGILEPHSGGNPERTVPCYVFGLPGNPVSSMVCCELFVRAALRVWSGIEPEILAPISARLEADHHNDGNRPTYHPAKIAWTADGPTVSVVDWIGSSDLCATVDANCTVLFPAGDRLWCAGARLEVFPW